MATHVALLRGINVGGRNKVPMAELRTMVSGLGFADVSTYIQSGNVLFSAAGTDTDEIASAIAAGLTATFCLDVGVVVVTRDELAAVISRNPYPDEANHKCLHTVFMAAEPSRERLDQLAAVQAAVREKKGGRDSLTVIGRVFYLHTPDGFRDSELARALARLTAGGTARNWATSTKLLELCDTRIGS
ncbi:MAG TPA: DUF1697 domain-containing protein [Streptosporangiaceae bacterium]|nr:DUF1697 domain-containing protein [Streptosporangiaceae bacterium]